MLNENIKVEIRENYIYAFQSGEDSFENSLELWTKVHEACCEVNKFKVLGESKTANNLSLRDAFQHVKFFEILDVPVYPKIAWVNHVPEYNETYHFIETIVTNRGLADVKLCKNYKEAEEWLLENNYKIEREKENDLLDDRIFIFNK
ncbi:hypothetical protein [Sediminitomix flava]|uniref:SpoIIAA-like protein n=1 Tax=Sediminitomix flava TaxID=379075 RepID=A0A315ZTB3_SEDFL|nr:hypothetical protein [Sediminitomix flava]PWJ38464.1 hypothetical protein BC781_10754 [Sediminitomix flava]